MSEFAKGGCTDWPHFIQIDVLNHGYGVKEIDMPALTQSIWTAIEGEK